MKKAVLLTVLVLGLCGLSSVLCAQSALVTAQSLNKMPLAFTKNMGQWDEQVQYRTSSAGATIWICKDKIVYQFLRTVRDSSKTRGLTGLPDDPMDRSSNDKDSIEQLVITAKFVGANPDVQVVGEEMMEYKRNYFLGNDPAKWHTDVPNYEAVTLRGIYAGVDVRFYGGEGSKLTYEYTLSTIADPNQIIVEYEGIEQTALDNSGRVTTQNKWGEIAGLLAQPASAAEFVGLSSGEPQTNAEISLAAPRSPQAVELYYSTYLGGSADDFGFGIAIDAAGSAYVTGTTVSSNFPMQDPFDGNHNGGGSPPQDVFVSKFSASGNSLVYSTYLGGWYNEYSRDIAVDAAGSAYVTGYTWSSNFPTLNAYDGTFNGPEGWSHSDGFVSKLSAAGNELVYSTYLGGSGGWDEARGIAVDAAGSAYVTGYTSSSDFPTRIAYDGSLTGNADAFLSKFSAAGSTLVYSTFFGGSSNDEGWDIAIDAAGRAYVTGATNSYDLPTQNAFDGSHNGGSYDVFVTKFTAAGNATVYSTYLGGSDNEWGRAIAVDAVGSAYVTGTTSSSNFPTQSAFDGSFNGNVDVFVSKLSAAGNMMVYSTYLGGSGDEFSVINQSYTRQCDIAVDAVGSAYVIGVTNSSDFPTQNAYDGSLGGGGDVFISKFSAAGNALVYSTYFGGSDADVGYGITVDAAGNTYVTGGTYSTDFPMQSPFDGASNGNFDVFVSNLSGLGGASPHISLPPTTLFFSAPHNGEAPIPQSFQLSNTGGGILNWSISANANWLDVSPITGSSNAQTINVSANTTNLALGTYSATITVTSPNANNSPQTLSVEYDIYQPPPHISIQPNGLTFVAPQDGSLPSSQTISLTNSGAGTLTWDINEQVDWFDISPYHGTGNNQQITVSIKGNSLSPGTYQHTFFVTSINADNSPQSVTITYNVPEIVPVVLVHGWTGDPGDWGTDSQGMLSWLKRDITPYVWPAAIEKCGHIREAGFKDWLGRVNPKVMYSGNAKVLSDFINSIKDTLPAPIKNRISRIDIVAHSMGGLVSRRYMNTRAGDDWNPLPVRRLIMLATPNKGAVWGGTRGASTVQMAACPSLSTLLYVAWDELGTSEMLQFNKEFPFRAPQSTDYYVFWGDKACPKGSFRCPPPTAIAGIRTPCPSDGVVDKESAIGYSCSQGGSCSTAYSKNWKMYLCHGDFTSDENLYVLYVKRALLGTLNEEPYWRQIDEDDSSTAQICYEHLGSCAAGSVTSDSFHVEANSSFMIALSSTDVGLHFSLISPMGVQYDSTSFVPDSSTVFLDYGVGGHLFYIENAQPGAWTWTVDGSGATSPTIDFEIVASCDNSVQVSAYQSLEYPGPVDTLSLQVRVTDGASGATGLSVISIPILDYHDTTNAIYLLDDGLSGDGDPDDGVYGALISNFSPGLIQFKTQIAGETSIGLISRFVEFQVFSDSSDFYLCGDADRSGIITISDAVYLINYIFAGGPAPIPVLAGNSDCNSIVTISDAVYLINYIFSGGAAPCAACP